MIQLREAAGRISLYYSQPRICFCIAKYVSVNNVWCYYEGWCYKKSKIIWQDSEVAVDIIHKMWKWTLQHDLLTKMAACSLAISALHVTLDIVSMLKAPAFTFMCISSCLSLKLVQERALNLTFTDMRWSVLLPRGATARTGREDTDW